MTDCAKFKDYVPNYLKINKSGLDTVKPTKEYLLIPFDKKDEIKKNYPIKYHSIYIYIYIYHIYIYMYVSIPVYIYI
jgi:hypothetical protein